MPIDLERQKQAREYARIRHRLFAVNLGLTGLALVLVIALGLGVWLKQWIQAITADAWIATYLYFVVGLVAYQVLFFPLSYYDSFVLPHRYRLSTQSLGSWLRDVAKGGLLMLLLGGLVIEVIYAVLRVAPGTWWLWASLCMILFNVLLANLAPVLILPLFFKFTPLQDAELVQRLTEIAARAHARVRGVYTMMLSEKTTAANAAVMGLGNTRRIVLGDTLYANYTHAEIETILAHELGHHVHHDIGWALVVESALTTAGFYVADLFLRWGTGAFHYAGLADLAAMPLFALALGLFGLITMPVGNAYSRWRERLADDYAVEVTRNAPAFVAAMEKLANQNLAELEPEPWVEFLLYDHPPIGKRVKRAST